MEESLRRLKRGRDKQQNANISSAPTPGAGGGQENTKSENKEKGVSDDDKIRLQLFVDVKHYIQTIKSLGVNVDSITDVSLKSFFKSIYKRHILCYFKNGKKKSIFVPKKKFKKQIIPS